MPPPPPRRAIAPVTILMLALLWAAPAAALAVTEAQPWLQRLLAREELTVNGLRLDLAALRRIYAASGHRALWTDADAAAVLRQADREGLDPADYPSNVQPPPGMSAGEALAWRDLLLTQSMLRYARDMHGGRIDLPAIDSLWTLPTPDFDPVAWLAEAAARGAVAQAVAELAPAHPQYRGLRAALARHRRMLDSGAGGAEVAERIRRIEAAMERWRWVPRDLPPRRVEVNVPAFRLVAYDDGAPRLDMRVVVGTPHAPTPSFTKPATAVVLNPSWTLPRSIAVWDYLPRARKDPGYLARKGIRVIDAPAEVARHPDGGIDWSRYGPGNFPFVLRQRPGPGNSLGRIKLAMPGDNAIYLHDTPEREKFAHQRRAFSHGCVRLEDPLALAELLLRRSGWGREDITAAIATGATRWLRLPEPVPVYALYIPVTVASDGAVTIHPDLYHRESLLMRALARSAAPPAG